MPPARPYDDTRDRFEDCPIAWFGEMVLALERRDIDRAAEAKRQLARLGWSILNHKPRPRSKGGTK
jgi:hypothetical protein